MKIFLLSLLVTVQGIAFANDDKPEIGRYQLLYGVIDTSSSAGGSTGFRTVWKIDTVTGKVWQFVSIMTKGKLEEKFVPMETREP